MPASTTPTAPGSGDVADALEPLRPAVAEVALFEWGTLVVRAGRNGPVLPHMVWLNRFSETIPREALEAEAQRLGSIPYGFGRRLLPARLPGGRPRWRASIEVPPVLFNDTPVAEGDELSAWVNGHLAMRLDPEHGPGWRMACTWTEDGHTIVMIFVHHIYGIAGGLLGALYGGSGVDPTDGTTGLRFDDPANDYTLAAERAGLRERFALGFRGIGQVGPELAAAWRARKAPSIPGGPAPLAKPRGRDRTRRATSARRVAAMATIPAELWDGTAEQWGGTGTTLAAAVGANLLRRARQARGGPAERPLQIVMPIDLLSREDVDRSARLGAGPSPETTMTTANLLLPGGAPAHGDLREIRARMKAAFIADTGTAPTVRGVPDVARLLPERIALRAAAKGATQFDGTVSVVGMMPDAMRRLGPYEASELQMMGFPIGNEALIGLVRYRVGSGVVCSLTVITDPERLGRDGDIREWLTEELAAWGIRDVVI
jgi:hypothetical protein